MAAKNEVVVANAFRKKSYLPQPMAGAFVEDRDAIVESRKQIVEVFIEKRASIVLNANLEKFKDMPILVDTDVPQIAELENSSRPRFVSRSSAGYVVTRTVKAE